jgi:hypothetical protein
MKVDKTLVDGLRVALANLGSAYGAVGIAFDEIADAACTDLDGETATASTLAACRADAWAACKAAGLKEGTFKRYWASYVREEGYEDLLDSTKQNRKATAKTPPPKEFDAAEITAWIQAKYNPNPAQRAALAALWAPVKEHATA